MSKIYFLDGEGNKFLLEKKFSEMKMEKKWKEIGIEDGGKKYGIDLINGRLNINGESVEIGKDINGYYEKFSDSNLDYGKNIIYYCESIPMGMGSKNLIASKIYLGYECELKNKINYNHYTVEKFEVLLVYDCFNKKIGTVFNTIANFNLDGKKIKIKI